MTHVAPENPPSSVQLLAQVTVLCASMPCCADSHHVTESQNHRMFRVGRDLCGSSSPTLKKEEDKEEEEEEDKKEDVDEDKDAEEEEDKNEEEDEEEEDEEEEEK